MQVAQGVRGRDGFKIGLHLLYIVSFLILGYFLAEGWSFYKTEYKMRPHHEQYRALRPAGIQGQGYGIVGSAMMLFMLVYSLRKRVKLFRSWGKLSRWLDIHIYFGVFGPLLVILHSAFKLNGIISIAFWSMIAVALSGVVGRYLYLQIPRSNSGHELDLNDVLAMEKQMGDQLRTELGLDSAAILKAEEIASPHFNQDQNVIMLFLSMLFQHLLEPFRINRLKHFYEQELNIHGHFLKEALLLSKRKTAIHRKILLLNKTQQLFHYWHVFHKPFAIIMYVIMFIHVGIATWLGYTWIF